MRCRRGSAGPAEWAPKLGRLEGEEGEQPEEEGAGRRGRHRAALGNVEEGVDRQRGPASSRGFGPVAAWGLPLFQNEDPTYVAGSAPGFGHLLQAAPGRGTSRGGFPYFALAFGRGAKLSGGAGETGHPGLCGPRVPRGPQRPPQLQVQGIMSAGFRLV